MDELLDPSLYTEEELAILQQDPSTLTFDELMDRHDKIVAIMKKYNGAV